MFSAIDDILISIEQQFLQYISIVILSIPSVASQVLCLSIYIYIDFVFVITHVIYTGVQ